MLTIPFELQYVHLPAHFCARVAPKPLQNPVLRYWNAGLAAELGITGDASAEAKARLFSGAELPAGADPLAQAYAGHQFGNFVPQLGDGRAVLLGEVRTPAGDLRDIQLKGSGRNPFSRGGDGRAPIGPVIRECLVSEGLHALGVPATRTLAVVSSDTGVVRDRVLPGAILTRVAASHLRVGTFQYFAARGDDQAIDRLVEFALERHGIPDSAGAGKPASACTPQSPNPVGGGLGRAQPGAGTPASAYTPQEPPNPVGGGLGRAQPGAGKPASAYTPQEPPNPVGGGLGRAQDATVTDPMAARFALLDAVVARQAERVAQWMHLGFVHGVLNTDNVTLSGETLDFGPCAFLEEYRAGAVFSSIDQTGRYAYNRQAEIMVWNLSRLAEALLATAEPDDAMLKRATDIIRGFEPQFDRHWLHGYARKLGFAGHDAGTADAPQAQPNTIDRPFVAALLKILQENASDYTLTWHRLADWLKDNGTNEPTVGHLAAHELPGNSAMAEWAADWLERLKRSGITPHQAVHTMRATNPRTIPRNHHVQAAIEAAEQGDYTVFERLLNAVTHPFSDAAEHRPWQTPANPENRVTTTFCGT